MRPHCRIESFYTAGTQRKIDCFNADGFCRYCNLVSEAMCCFYHSCLSRGTTCFNWKRHPTWNKKEGNGWNAETVYREDKLHCCPNVGMWMVETLQDWCVSKGTLEKINPLQASIVSGPVIGQDKIKRIVWLRSVRDIKIPEHLREESANLLTNSRKTNLCRQR